MRKLIILFAAVCLLTACDKDKEADYIAQYFFGQDSKSQVTPDEPDNGNATLAKACDALQKVSDIYMECRSIPDLKTHTDEISKIDNVEDVYFSDIAMFVKVKGFMMVSFCFYPEMEVPQIEQLDIPKIRQVGTRANTDYPFYPLGFKKAVIIDNQTYDRDWTLYKDALKEMLDKVGIKTEIINSPTLDYMRDGLFDNDIVLFISHGHYDPKTNLHWLNLMNLDDPDWSLYYGTSFWEYLKNDFSLSFRTYANVENDKISMTITQHWVDGRLDYRASYSVSENYISSIQKNFKRKALVFNVACQSLMLGDNSEKDNDQHDFAFAKAFIDRGAGVYFGYDESNGAGQIAGMLLLSGIASGQSVKGAFHTLPNWCIHDKRNKDDYHKTSYIADMFHYPEGNFDIENSCQVFPVLEEKDENDESIILKMSEPYNLMIYDYDSDNHIVTDVKLLEYEPNSYWGGLEPYIFTYGFEVSTTRDFAPSLTKDYGTAFCKPYSDNFTLSSDGYYHELHLSYPVPKNDLEPDTKYYYRAYMNDGTNKYYSDYKDFTFQGRIEQVVPDSIRDRMDPYIPIYEGNNPPAVEGVFLIDPAEIVYDTTNNYNAGDQGFTPIYLKFSNQSITQNTIDYEEKDVNNAGKIVSESSGPGAFISGEGDNFSVFFSTSGVNHRDTYDISYKTSLVISGTKTSSGIKDIRYAFVMVDKKNDKEHDIMNVGEFRVFKDGDGLATTASWPSGARSRGWGYSVRNGNITTPWSIFSKKK